MHSSYQISWVAIIQGSNWLDENFSRWKFPEWELSGWEISRWQFFGWEFSWLGVVRVGIFWVGVFLGGNCPGGTYPGWEFSSVEIFWVGIVRWESSGWKFYGWEFSCYPNKGFQVWNLFVLHILFHDIFEGAEYAWIYVKHYVSKLWIYLNKVQHMHILFLSNTWTMCLKLTKYVYDSKCAE